MKWLARLVVATAVLTTPLAASAQSLTEAQARAVITPWYRLFNQPVQGDMNTLQEQVLTADYESCWGYLPGECWGRDASIKVVGGVIVRGEVTGTPAGDLFGVPHSGKRLSALGQLAPSNREPLVLREMPVRRKPGS